MTRDAADPYLSTLRSLLESRVGVWAPGTVINGIEFQPGLTDTESDSVEARFAFTFPPDLRLFLQTVLPTGDGLPDWRDGRDEQLRWLLDGPLEGICFDIEHNEFWLPEWGPRPDRLAGALEVARRNVMRAPCLIPIDGHRYLPDLPHESGNPIFSVVQTDIVRYERGLLAYWFPEARETPHASPALPPRRIPFWDRLVEVSGNSGGM